ncbi:MAG: dephospho-CoA kinase [Saprospiraceae bacterium]|nr:dephospho-CoA kinase [Saprospiraceae bacterium]
MYKIGITGGIGAGKSTVSKIFAVLGIPIYYADTRAKDLMLTDQSIRQQIVDLLGPQAYNDDQALNSKWIAEQVFSDPWQLNLLNSIVHPAVEGDYERWHKEQTGVYYTLKEAALIYDAGSYLQQDATIVVIADESIRIERVCKRDASAPHLVKARMQQQWPEYRRLQLADFTIDNNGDQMLVQQVIKVHEELCRRDSNQ